MKPITEMTEGELYSGVMTGLAGPNDDGVDQHECMAELLRRERGRCVEEIKAEAARMTELTTLEPWSSAAESYRLSAATLIMMADKLQRS